jgi:hypothetical protein
MGVWRGRKASSGAQFGRGTAFQRRTYQTTQLSSPFQRDENRGFCNLFGAPSSKLGFVSVRARTRQSEAPTDDDGMRGAKHMRDSTQASSYAPAQQPVKESK